MALLHLVYAAVLLAVPVLAGEAPGPTITGIGKRASECFVTLRGIAATDGKNHVDCTDGDSSCDVDGAADGACTFNVRVCVAQASSGCQAATITSVKATPKKAGLLLPPVPATTPVCGDQATIYVKLNGDVIDVRPGTIVYIEPHTRHRLWSEEGVRTIVFGVPALQPDDEYFD